MNPIDKAINVAKFQNPAGTLGEYLQHKADSVRNAAYETSKTTKEVRVPILELTEDAILKLKQEFQSNKQQMDEYLAMKNRPMWMPVVQTNPFTKNRDDAWYIATKQRNDKIQEMLKSGCKKRK